MTDYFEEQPYHSGATVVKVEVEVEEGRIIQLAADRLLVRFIERGEEATELRRRVKETTDAVIREAVTPLVEAAIRDEQQPTDAWGKAKGKPTTLAERIEAEVKGLLTEERGDYNRRETYLRKFIREEVEKAVKADLSGVMATARTEVQAAVKDQAAALLAETIARMGR